MNIEALLPKIIFYVIIIFFAFMIIQALKEKYKQFMKKLKGGKQKNVRSNIKERSEA
jgi:preprotein translocase subunit SecG